MLELKNINTVLDYPNVYISWEIESELSNIFIWIYRSYGSDDFELLTSLPLVNAFAFTDYSLPTKEHYNPVIYKIKAIDARAGVDPNYTGTDYDHFTSGYIDIYTRLNKYDYLRYNEMVRKNRLRLDARYGGVPVYLYKRKTFGPICSECGSDIVKQATKSNCTTCYGVGREGGYHLPFIIATAMFTESSQKTRRKADRGPVVPLTFNVDVGPPPLIDVNDVIFRPDADESYLVRAITIVRFKESLPINLICASTLLHRDDIVMQLPRVLSSSS
jgi:hypothetical protein